MQKSSKLLQSSLLVSLTFALLESSVYAKSIETQTIAVPVLFATTRRMDEHKQFSGFRNFQHKDHQIIYGMATVQIESSHLLDAKLKALGCSIPDKKGNTINFNTFDNESAFQNDVREKLNQPQNKEVCVFVHGYNNGFGDGLESAARMEVSLGQPVILFSWPSRDKPAAYMADECSVEWSLRPFQIFMHQLTENVGAKRVMTVSHSMGNRLVNWYMQMRNDDSESKPEQLSEIVLTSPDIDRATFKNYFYKLVNCAGTVRVYVSGKDKALRASELLHGEGRAGSTDVPEELKWQVPSNLPHASVVDFTSVDSGWLGHSIQFDIISSMHQKNEPGTNLRAVPNPTYKGEFIVIEPVSKP